MATETPNLELTKPDPTDVTEILDDFNDNMDKIDAAAETRLFVGPTAPSGLPAGAKYVWIETDLGVGGDDMTIWVEDGV